MCPEGDNSYNNTTIISVGFLPKRAYPESNHEMMPDKPTLKIVPQNKSLVHPKMSRTMSTSRKTRKVEEGFQFRGLERYGVEVGFVCFLCFFYYKWNYYDNW